MVEVYLHLLPKVQHVLALDNSHLQVVQESLESCVRLEHTFHSK